MKWMVITAPDFVQGEASLIMELFKAGLDKLHFRKPGADILASERLLQEFPEEVRSRIIIHDLFQLKEKYQLGGIHLNSRHPVAPAGYQGQQSRSCHSLEEVQQSLPSLDYVFLSPIYDSISKQGYESGYSYESLRQAQEDGIINEKVIALGGVCEQNIVAIKSLGFGGVALLGDIWNRYHTLGDVEAVVAHFKRLKEKGID